MADIVFSDDFDQVETEEVEVSPLDEESEDDAIDPQLFVQKYINSDDTVKRQRVARSLGDVMRWTEGDEDVEVVLLAAEQLSVDLDPRVRIDVIEELPDITAFCLEESKSIDLVLNRLLPILAKYLCDSHDQVRKSGHSTLFSLLEHQLIGSVDVEHFMVPVLAQMTTADNCMSQLEAARVIMRVTPMMEPEVIDRVFIRLIMLLSGAQFFEVRKTCASGFGLLAQAVGYDLNEKVVLPLFRTLCTDTVWGVRKGCAEALVDVSLACTLEQRRNVLCTLCLSFLQDSSKWVQKSAYQVLGPFIATFHDPLTAFVSDNDKEEEQEELLSAISPIPLVDSDIVPERVAVSGVGDNDCDILKASIYATSNEQKPLSHGENAVDGSTYTENVELLLHVAQGLATVEGFSSFLYWKTPLPDISSELESIDNLSQTSSSNAGASSISCNLAESLYNKDDEVCQVASATPKTQFQDADANNETVILSESDVAPEDPTFYRVSEFSGDQSSVEEVESLVMKQDVVPEELLDYYISMIEPSQAQLVDPDLPLHCAYSFPGVAITLGKEHWCCIKPIYGVLCSDMQWKVRRTLSFSVHEVAKLLGKELIESELITVFDDFLKDLDEVRIGVLSHFSEFVELISPELQKRYLSYLPTFQQMDNKNNWRFRQALAEQLGQLCNLCKPIDIHTHVVPIAINLATDKVADVRSLAVDVLGRSLCHLRNDSDMQLADQLIEDVRDRFGLSNRWLMRQTFVRFCQAVLSSNYVTPHVFAENFLDSLLDLASDSVANVRLAVSRAISENLLSIDILRPVESGSSHYSLSVSLAISQLLKDPDRDVRNFVAEVPDVARFVTQDFSSQIVQADNDESGDELDALIVVETSSILPDVYSANSSILDIVDQPVSGQNHCSDGAIDGDSEF